jgi:hypothetical protein
MKKPLIVISVSGGVVQEIFCNKPIEVIVADFDEREVGKRLCSRRSAEKLSLADPEIQKDSLVRGSA